MEQAPDKKDKGGKKEPKFQKKISRKKKPQKGIATFKSIINFRNSLVFYLY